MISSNDPASPNVQIELIGIGALDEDGLDDAEEFGPDGDDPDYDGNDDGVPDSQQGHVASMHTYGNSSYVTLFTSDDSIHLSDMAARDNPSPADMPDVQFPLGFFEFTACCSPWNGFDMTVTLLLPQGTTPPDTYYKFGPTPDNPVPHWYEFMYEAESGTGAVISEDAIVLHFVDGQRGDDDLWADGSITDIGAPGHRAVNDDDDGGSCFIATAAYGSYLAPEVRVLRRLRDEILLTNELGSYVVELYYAHSPPISDLIRQHEVLRLLTRWALTPLVYAVKYPVHSLLLFLIIIHLLGYRVRKNS
jgi:hypothetical protein